METKHFESLYPVDTRSEEITAVLKYIQEGKSSQVLSVPGGGRSNFFGLLSYNKALRQKHLEEQEKWLHFVLIDFSQVRDTSLLEVYKLLFLELIDSLNQRELGKAHAHTKQLFSEAITLSDELMLFQALKKAIEFLTLEKQLTIVFLFDRFEEYLPMLTPDFFRNLRILADKAKYRFSVVFSLHKPLEDITEPELIQDFSEFFVGNTVYLHLYDKVGIDFRIAYIEKVGDKTLSEDVKNAILEQTGGHAKLTRVAAETALRQNYKLRITNDGKDSSAKPQNDPSTSQRSSEEGSGLRTLLEEESIQRAVEDIWQSLNPAEQTHFLKDLFPSVLDDEHSQYLQKVGLMTSDTITLRLFAAFVQNKREEKPEQQTSNYTEISDKLTATEFRLLQYFLEHPNTILERNVIIQGVWKENKSVAGVTDQALDQVIWRLRQKIEEDPNHPTHLVTVKGRGFRFTP